MKKFYYFILLSASFALAQPAITNPTPLHSCDPDGDGFTTFDLTQKTTEVLGSLDPATVTVSYYVTFIDAQNNANAIQIPTLYNNLSPGNQVVFVGAWYNSDPASIAVKPLELVVDLSPTATVSGPGLVCLGSSADLVFTGSGGTAPYTFTYSVNGGSAQTISTVGSSDTVTVTLPTIYGTTQILLYSSQSSANACIGDVYQPLTINVDAFPAVNINDYVIYESPTDGVAQFDLNSRTAALTDNAPGLTVTYYVSYVDATAGTNAINTAVPFTNTSNPQFIHARIQNGNGCFFVQSFFLIVQDSDIIYIPDTFLKTMLTNQDAASSIVSDTPGHHILLDANADGEIQVSEAANVHYIEFPNSNVHSLQGLERFSNLKFISGSGCSLTTAVDLSNMPNLHHLDLAGDQISYLNVANSGIQELFCSNNYLTHLDLATCSSLLNLQADTNYNLSSIDVAGLSQLQTLSVYINKLPSLNLSGLTSLQTLDCRNNEISSLDFSGITTLQTINCNGNHLSTLDVSGQSGLQTLACAGNDLTSLDVSQNPALQVLHCNDNNLTTLDCSQNHALSYLRCYANQLQTLFIKNGSNETFDAANWIENPNLYYICADDSQLQSLTTAVGNENVSINSYCTLEPGAPYNTITGTIKIDTNGNGCEQSDPAASFIRLSVTGSETQGAVYTNADGVYTIFTGAGDTSVAVTFENSNYYDLVLPSGYNFPTAGGSVATQDICLNPSGVHPDLEVVVAPLVPARPGFEAVYKITYKNKGNQIMNGIGDDITLNYDANHLAFSQSDTLPFVITPGALSWTYSNLQPFESRSIVVTFSVNAPSDANFPVNVGDVLDFSVQIEPIPADETPEDNVYAYSQTVIGSFDPNNMYCVEGDVVSTDAIGKYLHYIVNFENTGTDMAENIVVADEINPNQYDISSLQILESSDDVDISIVGNKVTFFFHDIKLPIGGHGNILLKIKSNGSLTQGDSVLNNANIFFDYNLPIATNDAQTLFQLLGIPASEFDASVSIYPNPTNGVINVKAATTIRSMQVYDVQGRLLQTGFRNAGEVSIDVSAQPSGIYFLKITSDKGIKVEKFVKN